MHEQANPWVRLIARAEAIAKDVAVDWQSRRVAEVVDLAERQAQRLSREELCALVQHAPSVMLPEQEPFYSRDRAETTSRKNPLVQTLQDQKLVCFLAGVGLLKQMPDPESHLFRHAIQFTDVTLPLTVNLAAVAIDLHQSAESQNWLYQFVFTEHEGEWILKECALSVAPLLVGYENAALLDNLTEKYASETAKKRQGMMDIVPEAYLRNEWVEVLRATLEAEKYCRGLDDNSRAEFRDFYKRMHQTLACAPKMHRSSWGRPRQAAATMNRKPSDEQFYSVFLETLNGSELETQFIVCLYEQRAQPIDVPQLRVIANGASEKARLAKRILDLWQAKFSAEASDVGLRARKGE